MDPREREPKPLVKPITWVSLAGIAMVVIAAISTPSTEKETKLPTVSPVSSQLSTETVVKTSRIYVVDHGNFVDETIVTTLQRKK